MTEGRFITMRKIKRKYTALRQLKDQQSLVPLNTTDDTLKHKKSSLPTLRLLHCFFKS